MRQPSEAALPSWPLPGPIVIGGTGGSGTRAVAAVVRRAGLWIGDNLNVSLDAIDFGLFSNRWIDLFLACTDRWRLPLDGDDRTAMLAELAPLLERHLAPLTAGEPGHWTAWGWKEPRSMYLLPLWDSLFPSLRFLHVVRDGRDMALSANQNQLRKHGVAMLGTGLAEQPEAVRSIALWSRANAMVAEFAARRLGTRYLRIRFEDLCCHPAVVVGQVLAFANLRADPRALAAELIEPPASLGRWRRCDRHLLATLHREAAATLASFGYPVPWRAHLAAARRRLIQALAHRWLVGAPRFL